jgi:hypothetical protein
MLGHRTPERTDTRSIASANPGLWSSQQSMPSSQQEGRASKPRIVKDRALVSIRLRDSEGTQTCQAAATTFGVKNSR